jgi:hypothetical protein
VLPWCDLLLRGTAVAVREDDGLNGGSNVR